MKPSSRLLLIFGAIIGILVIVALVLVLMMDNTGDEPLLPEDTPEGTVQRYLLALEDGDYLKAYSYLSPPPSERLHYEEWRDPFIESEEGPALKVVLEKSTLMGNEASVDVVVDVFRPSGPFGNPVHTHHINFFLEKEGTSWMIISPVDVWWLFY